MRGIRKIHVATEEIRLEAGRPVEPPLITVIVAAVMQNPWAGRPFVEDLHPEILGFAHDLGALLAGRLVDEFGSSDAVEAYGKSSVVGVDGEIEHANAMVHTLMFGDPIRAQVDGASTLVFSNTRGGPGAPIVVPMVHKREMLERSHYHTRPDLHRRRPPGRRGGRGGRGRQPQPALPPHRRPRPRSAPSLSSRAPEARALERPQVGESLPRRSGVFPAVVRCAHGPLGPRPRALWAAWSRPFARPLAAQAVFCAASAPARVSASASAAMAWVRCLWLSSTNDSTSPSATACIILRCWSCTSRRFSGDIR